VRRDTFFETGQFDETRGTLGVEDLDLYFRLAPTEPVAFMKRVVLHKRRHATNMSSDWARMRASAEWTLDRAESLYKEKHRDLLPIVVHKKTGLLTGWARADIDAGRPQALSTAITLVKYAPFKARAWWLLAIALGKTPFAGG
jgi:GT2 family glycosyltransferase